jgi:DNA-binding beta-propeller fold protein YncE
MERWVSSDVSVIDLGKGRVRRLLKTAPTPRGLWPTAGGRRLYADDMGTKQAFVVDLASERVRRLVGTDNVPSTIDLTPDGRVLYVSHRGRNGAPYYYAVPPYAALAAGGGGRAVAHRAELAKP